MIVRTPSGSVMESSSDSLSSIHFGCLSPALALSPLATASVAGALKFPGALLFALQLLLTKTKIGLAFRAVSSNLESSELVGIRVGPTLQFGWALAAAVGALGASVYVANPVLSLEPSVMLRVLIFAVSAAALGGLDSLWGTIVGGLGIGMVQSLLVQYAPFIPTEMSLAAAVVVLMIVLLFKPAGLFGTAAVERV